MSKWGVHMLQCQRALPVRPSTTQKAFEALPAASRTISAASETFPLSLVTVITPYVAHYCQTNCRAVLNMYLSIFRITCIKITNGA